MPPRKTAKKTASKKAPAKKAAKKAAPAKKAAKKAVKKATKKVGKKAAKKVGKKAAKAAPAKKTAGKKAAKKAAGKKTAKKATKAAPAKKTAKKAPAAKKAAKKAPAKRGAAKKVARAPARKPAAAPSSDQEEEIGRPGPKPGDQAPTFSLAADDGNTYSLDQLSGRRVVLYFYPRDNTPGCTTEACDFRDRQAQFTAAGALVLGVSGDSLASHARFRAAHDLNFPLLSDPGNQVAAAYGAYGEKKMYGRTVTGIIRSTFVIGPDGRLEAVYSPVRVAGHADALLAALSTPAT